MAGSIHIELSNYVNSKMTDAVEVLNLEKCPDAAANVRFQLRINFLAIEDANKPVATKIQSPPVSFRQTPKGSGQKPQFQKPPVPSQALEIALQNNKLVQQHEALQSQY